MTGIEFFEKVANTDQEKKGVNVIKKLLKSMTPEKYQILQAYLLDHSDMAASELLDIINSLSDVYESLTGNPLGIDYSLISEYAELLETVLEANMKNKKAKELANATEDRESYEIVNKRIRARIADSTAGIVVLKHVMCMEGKTRRLTEEEMDAGLYEAYSKFKDDIAEDKCDSKPDHDSPFEIFNRETGEKVDLDKDPYFHGYEIMVDIKNGYINLLQFGQVITSASDLYGVRPCA